jgi:hypothetical protein
MATLIFQLDRALGNLVQSGQGTMAWVDVNKSVICAAAASP